MQGRAWSAASHAEPDERVGGPGKFLLEGPNDVIHDVNVCKSYVFADSQGSRLFFPVVENVVTHAHTVTGLAAISQF